MIKSIFVLVLLLSPYVFAGDSYVRGYVRRDGTYVQGHHRSKPDNTINNNYGTSGNRNIYTGENGDRARNPYQGYGNYNSGNGLGGQPKYNYNSGYDSND
jgi:hypothetical protein